MSLWDDVEDIEYRPIHRTKPKYPTYGPGDGRSWHEYFNELRAQSGEGADQSAAGIMHLGLKGLAHGADAGVTKAGRGAYFGHIFWES